MSFDGKRQRTSPTEVIATNRKTTRLMDMFSKRHGLSKQQMTQMSYRFLLGPQLLIPTDPSGKVLAMSRGNTLVEPEDVTRESVDDFANLMIEWMFNSLHDDGRMTYLYWPSQGQEAPKRDNLIRQFMATIALGRSAARRGDPALFDRAEQNIDYNLQKYFRAEGELGLVELRGKVKLGAVALAALAIVEHPKRAKWKHYEMALRRTVDELWHEDGSFTTFYLPKGRNDNQNFYPGEALLLWASLYEESKNPKLLERIMKTFAHYRKWHLDSKNRNPAFIPWHTQAYYKIWKVTSSKDLADFIFEMNDWLLGMQQWDDVLYPDTRGRFHDPKRPFGPPHASSTGVYLEGLIDAYELAKALDDNERAARYQQAIRRGLRSSMQLQFVDDVDMFYITKRDAVRGGLRTTVYDNQIRCDNVQHTLMGTMKILDSDVLGPTAPKAPAKAAGDPPANP
jgi:hypothetical protein